MSFLLVVMNKFEIDDLLCESGVWNTFAHVADGNLHTAITSYEELVRLIELAYDKGMSYLWAQNTCE